jgi:plasmid stabilization system protein ParE
MEIASKWVKIIKGMADNLSHWPKKCRLYDEELGYRILNVKKKYIVLYSINEKRKIVTIEHIFDRRRDWQRLVSVM